MRVEEVAAGLNATVLLYWENAYLQKEFARVVRLVHDEKRYFYVVLDRSIFYPKGGGQPSDRGLLRGEGFTFEVKKAMHTPTGVIILWGKLAEGLMTEGRVLCEIDWAWRYLLMRRHTAAHLLDCSFSQILGRNLKAYSSWLGDVPYVEYEGELPPQAVLELAFQLAAEKVERGAEVKSEIRKLEASGVVDRGDEEMVFGHRTVTIGGCAPVPCGGTHVRNVREVDAVCLRGAEGRRGLFRVYFDVNR